jgi:hypothetical protein
MCLFILYHFLLIFFINEIYEMNVRWMLFSSMERASNYDIFNFLCKKQQYGYKKN